jgi:hypothetical protein
MLEMRAEDSEILLPKGPLPEEEDHESGVILDFFGIQTETFQLAPPNIV